MKLEGKIAVITGGSDGIGLATAKRFVDEGAYVFITGRNLSTLTEAQSTIGRNVSIVQGDVAELEDLDRLYAQVRQEKGVIDIVVANAGIGKFHPLADGSAALFDSTFDINVRGLYFTVAKALPLMTRGGSIVLISSGIHVKAAPLGSIYAASKAAVRSFARSWAVELKDRAIRVNTLSPGVIDTPIHGKALPSKEATDHQLALMTQRIPMKRLGTADEMAASVLFLASEDSSYTTGIDLFADGGLSQV